jgi:hypothetical protein
MRVNIVGKGSGWKDAPEDNCWGITQLICKRKVDRVIDMNDYRLWGDVEEKEAHKARKIAESLKIEYIDLQNYPLPDVINWFNTDYFGSTVDYAIALALFEEYNDIHLYGINMLEGTEYRHQKPSCEFWIGYARGIGGDVTNHSKLSSLMRTKDGLLYGYGTKQSRN